MGVSETAPTDETVKPAPPVDPSLPTEEQIMEDAMRAIEEEADDGKAKVIVPDHLKDDVSIEMEEIPDDEVIPGVDTPITDADEFTPDDDEPHHDEL